MPKLDEIQGAEFMQVGKSNGFELFRLLNRKIDPPRDDLAFDLRTEIPGLGNHAGKDFGQAVRFVALLDRLQGQGVLGRDRLDLPI